MDLRDYVEHDATGLSELIRRGEVTAVEAEQCAREAANLVQPVLNGLVAPMFDEPLAYDAGGPFAGVPFLIKDLVIHAVGVPIAFGSRLCEGFVAPTDTDLMARFRSAGLATLGRTNTPEWGYNSTTEPVANGATCNPWDVTLSPGGSSGGSSVLVAAGVVPVAHANDGGGSIRIPASACGLVGLKPTRGRVPIGPETDEGLFGMGIEFAVTRTVRDAAALLDAVAGPGVGEKYEIASPTRPYARELGADPGRLRVGLMTEAPTGHAVERTVVEAAEATARTLEGLGHHVEPIALELDGEAFLVAMARIWSANLAAWVRLFAGLLGREPSPETLEACSLACVRYGETLTALELLEALRVNNDVCRKAGAAFSGFDAILSPTLGRPPWPLSVLDQDDPELDALAFTRRIFEPVPFTPLYNVTGQPAISLPLQTTADGRLPIGIQLAAPFGDETTLFRLAAQLEEALPWRTRRPPVHATELRVSP